MLLLYVDRHNILVVFFLIPSEDIDADRQVKPLTRSSCSLLMVAQIGIETTNDSSSQRTSERLWKDQLAERGSWILLHGDTVETWGNYDKI